MSNCQEKAQLMSAESRGRSRHPLIHATHEHICSLSPASPRNSTTPEDQHRGKDFCGSSSTNLMMPYTSARSNV